MSDLIKRLNKAKGSPTLKSVLLGMFDAERTCLEAADALAAKDKRIEELEAALRHAHSTLGEINQHNYTHDDVCALNDKSVEVILALGQALAQED